MVASSSTGAAGVSAARASGRLPWSVEPLPGWPGTKHPHTDEVTGGREASPGWTQEEKDAVARLRARCLELSLEVSGHPFWREVETEKLAQARSELKQVTRAAATAALDITEAA
ncbi:hypothetical protein [Streptomyces sp. TRM70350]|uniref:hypothetical protein n=1 Tax=Streptomyces sp. TRM70350 TaxID=2856165 RepID=UPI001C447442|nr:hypothetical protein [Streptomyces sp. TRM70350]MBV7701039.1 hypothetical protein [Streptomyces sp. TRM70350]